jgi:hypothetical protein
MNSAGNLLKPSMEEVMDSSGLQRCVVAGSELRYRHSMIR